MSLTPLLEIVPGESYYRVVVRGDLDMATVPTFKSRMSELVAQGVVRFVVDMTEVEHADTTGLGILVWLHKTAEHEGGALCLLGGPPQFRRVLELTGLNQLFTFHEQLSEAESFLGCV